MTADRFLAMYFRAVERRESPACVSVEARSPGGYEAAQHADAVFAWASGIMGTLQRTGRLSPLRMAVLRRVYLSLSNQHVALIAWRSPGQPHPHTVGVVHLAPGQAPPEAAEVQSWVSWRAMGADLGVSAARCQRMWHGARAEVAAELEAREQAAESSGTEGSA